MHPCKTETAQTLNVLHGIGSSRMSFKALSWLRKAVRVPGQISWHVAGMLFIMVVMLLMFSFYISQGLVQRQPWYYMPATCHIDPALMTDLVSLAHHMDAALNKLQVAYALCYGTLWGALRQGAILSWDNNIDTCALESQFSNISNAHLQQIFKQEGMSITFSWQNGVYEVSLGRAVGYIHLFAVSKDGTLAFSWEQSLWRLFGYTQVPFPVNLLDVPLNTVIFHGKPMPVPHEGIEILKYLYPKDWWLEVRPPNC